MMAERELEELFRAWRSEAVPPSLPPSVDDRGGSAVVAEALRRVAEQRRQRQRTRKFGLALALAAAVSGLGVGAWYELGRGPVAVQVSAEGVALGEREGDVAVTDDVGRVVPAVAALAEGYGVRTEQGSATLGFPSGASAKVASRSSLKVTRARQQEALFLARGGVDVEVPKLGPERGFSVETPDALVTVHGTRFSVAIEPGAGGPRTRVQVAHGIVSVQQRGREVFLTAGQSWVAASAEPAPLDAPAPSAEGDAGEGDEVADDEAADDEVADEAPAPSATSGHERGRRSAARRTFDPHELADQNKRFARAMALKKNGEAKAALRELARILRRYPGSPLTQEVRVERLRLLRGLGSSRQAAREATRYLREFPEGYAVNEAKGLASGAR